MTRTTRSTNRSRPTLLESLESRLFLDGTPINLTTVFANAQAHFQSPNVKLSIAGGAQIVSAGQILTVTVNSVQDINVFCSDAASSVTVDGTLFTTNSTGVSVFDTGSFGVASPDAGHSITVPAGQHTLVFTILPTALTNGITDISGGGVAEPVYTGPWVVADGLANGNLFSSSLPFNINNTNHLAFLQQPTNTAAGGTLSPPVKVAIEDASGNILTDNDSTITLEAERHGTLDPGQSDPAAKMVNGIATFPALFINNAAKHDLVAATQGFHSVFGNFQPLGMFATSNTFTVGGASVGGTLALAIAKSTLPTSIVTGATLKGTVTVTVSNTADTPFNGSFTMAIFASKTGTVDANSISLGTLPVHGIVSAHGSSPVSININSLPVGLTSGSYQLFAKGTDPANNVVVSAAGPALAVAAPFFALTETIASLSLPASAVSGVKTNAALKLQITDNGNVPLSGTSHVTVSASLVRGVPGTTILSLPEKISAKQNKPTPLTLQLKALPALADGDYFIVVQITDPNGQVTTVSSASTTKIAAPFVSFTAAFAALSKSALTSGANLTLTNTGNVPDTTPLTETFGFSTDSAGLNAVGSFTHLTTKKLTIPAGKSIKLKLTGWKSIASSLAPGTYSLTTTIKDQSGVSVSAVSLTAVTIA